MDVWTDDVLRDVLRESRRRRQLARGRRVAGVAAGLLAGIACAWGVARMVDPVSAAEPIAEASPSASSSVTAVLSPALRLLTAPLLPAPLAARHPSLVDVLLASMPPPPGDPAGAEPDGEAPGSAAESLALVVEDALAPGDTLISSLARHGISAATVALIAREMSSHVDFRRLKPGQHYRIERGDDGSLVSFRYDISPHEHYELVSDEDGWQTRVAKRQVLRQQARLSGVVSTTLYDAIQDLGERPELASDFANIFAWDVDFAKGVHAGDQFHILYERTYAPRSGGSGLRYLGPGRILAARYEGADRSLEAVYYETAPGQGGYYRPNGESVEQHFLAAPLRYTRISSSFTHARFHPILHITRPHPGIDYAAPIGTPVWAVASGRVSYAGWAGGFGRLVKIRHEDGYESYYAHLSAYARGLKVGDRVSQKQVIGYVGQSGLATGPHVCFRITKNGSYVNPASVRVPSGGSIPSDDRQDFETVRDARLAQLGSPTLVATDDAM